MAREMQGAAILLGALATLAALVALAPGLLSDPYIRSDDYPVLLGDGDLYWSKTLSEGRWINWLWTHRPWPGTAQGVMAIHLAAWSLTAGFAGLAVFRGDRTPWRALVLALAVGLAPQTVFMTNWPATTAPASVLLAISAGFAALAPPRRTIGALWVLLPIGLMTHGTYPLAMLLLTAAAVAREPAPGDALRLAVTFVGGFALGILAIFTINLIVHGHFGVQVASWRDPQPATDLLSLWRNLGTAAGWLARDISLIGLQTVLATAVIVLLFAAAILRLAMARSGGALGLAMLLALGVAAAIIVKTGVAGGFRAGLFLMLAILFAVAHAARVSTGAGRIGWVLGLVLLWLPGVVHWSIAHTRLQTARAEILEIAQQIEAADPAGGTIMVVGDPQATPAGGATQGAEKLAYDLNLLTGRAVRLCLPTEPACTPALEAAGAAPVWPKPGALLRLADGSLLLHLPRLDQDHPGAARLPAVVEWTRDGQAVRRQP